jgi:hypothetical protein
MSEFNTDLVEGQQIIHNQLAKTTKPAAHFFSNNCSLSGLMRDSTFVSYAISRGLLFLYSQLLLAE